MQKYQSIISGTNGSVIRNVPVTVLKEDGSLAEIFMDREGQVLAPNPLVTDSRGVFYFYAKNGRYSLRTAADGVQITDADTVLLFDPDETASDGPIADAVRRAEDAAERAETALGDSGLQNMVQDAQDAAANAVQAVIDANQAVASIDAALIEAGEAKDAAQAAAQTASNAASGAQAVKDSLLTYSGTLSATPEWSAVPAHEDLNLDTQAQALADRSELLRDNQKRAPLHFATLAEASAAAATLPDGQVVDVQSTLLRYNIESGVLVDERPTTSFTPTGGATRSAQSKLAEFLSVKDYGAAEDGVTKDTTPVSKAITEANLSGKSLIVSTGPGLAFNSLTIPTWMTIGAIQDIAQGRNLIPNGNFHTWQRVDVRQLSPAEFNVAPPTFGSPSTYDGTGGLKVYTADMWCGQIYGLYGTQKVARKAITPAEAKITTGSEFCLNWNATSVTPPAAMNKAITNITSPTAATVTVESPGHGRTNGAWVWINATYNGGLGGFVNQANEASFQISNVTTDTFDITITPDPGFTSWVSFGAVSDDPDGVGFSHVYDASLTSANPARRKWIRNGTASHVLSCKLPGVRYGDGTYTVRLRMRRNSGSPVIRIRLGYDFGSGGSPTGSNTTVMLLAAPTSGSDIIDYIGCTKLPDIAAAAFGSAADTGYMSVEIGADATTFDVDIFSIAVRPGVAALSNDNWTKYEAYPYLRQFYAGVRLGVNQSTTSGNYYGVAHSFEPPMRGTPTVNHVRSIASVNFTTPTISNNRTKEGFNALAQASAAGVSIWSSIFEAEYNIPT